MFITNNTIQANGSLSIVLFDTEKNMLKKEIFIPNLVVATGKTFIASRMVSASANVMSHVGLGLSANAETSSDVALVEELTTGAGYTGYARQTFTSAVASNNVVTYTATFAANIPSNVGGAAIREAGIFNAASGGTMLCRTTFPTVTKLPADSLTITWSITIA